MKKITNLRQLLIEQLNSLCYTEKQQVKNLKALMDKARSNELKEIINKHLTESKQQVQRLTNAFDNLKEECSMEAYEGIDGLINETNNLIENCERPEVKDAAIIKSLQQINHYEIASYGSACSYARALGLEELASRLHESLEEEKNIDQRLTDIAKEKVNEKAIEEV